jgi:hypothetical protein
MKRKLIALAVSGLLMIGCVGPAKVDVTEEIAPNETAFVIPLEGDSKKNQAQFDSVGYLQSKKVATKRIYIPQVQLDTGRGWWNYKYVPSVKVIKVNRAPVTFVWEGIKGRNKGIAVESRDSIGFMVGINISAYVTEADTATFLYHYPSGNLNKVLGNIVKSKTTENLSREFARYDLEGSPAKFNKAGRMISKASEGARQRKGEIVDLASKDLKAFFKETGVTISTFGLIGGLSYEDKEIQEAINDNFKSELDIKNKANDRLAQEEVNKNNIAIATADKLAAQEFAKAAQARKKQVDLEIEKMLAEAKLVAAKAWDGKLPANIMPEGANMIMDLSGK